MAKYKKVEKKGDRIPDQRTRRVAPATREPRIKEETKHGILAVVSLALTVFFLLGSMKLAGKAGNFFYTILHNLFGAGYFLIPVIFLLLGISFLKAVRPNFLATRFVGSLIFFFASLGVLSIAFGEETGGMIGRFISRPAISLFDYYFSLIFFAALDLISCLVIFDT